MHELDTRMNYVLQLTLTKLMYFTKRWNMCVTLRAY